MSYSKLCQFTLELDGIAAIQPAVRREVFRFAIGKAGEHWWVRMLPIHFTNQAYAKYSYKPRAPGYERAKRRRQANGQGRRAIGEVKPLVWTGESRDRATSNMNVVARAASHTRYYALVILNAPALNWKNPSSDINMRAEVLRVPAVERAVLQGVFQQWAVKEFRRRGHTQKLIRIIKPAA